MELEPQDNLNGKKAYALEEGATFGSGKKKQSQSSHNTSVTVSPHSKREERNNNADDALNKPAVTNDCMLLNSNVLHDNSVLNELDGGNSSSFGILMNKNKSQQSIVLSEGSQRFKDVGREEYGTWSMRWHEYLDFDNNSNFLIGKTRQMLDSSILTSGRTVQPEHFARHHGVENCILNPKSLNKIWTTEIVKTPDEKSNGSLPTNMDINWNQESDDFTNNRLQIDNSEEKTSTGSSKNYQSLISDSNLASSTGDTKTDRITSFLTGVRTTWADFVEEQLATQNFSIDVAADGTTLFESENYLKTQLVKKRERRTWEDMVEEEQFATQNLSIDTTANDINVVAFENCLKTQLIRKSERRTWADMVEEEESSTSVNYSSSKATVHTIKNDRDSSEQFSMTPLLFNIGRSTWTFVPEEDGYLTDENSRNGSALDPRSRRQRDSFIGQPALKSISWSEWISNEDFQDENTNLNIFRFIPIQEHCMSQNCKEICRTAQKNSSVCCALSFDPEPISDPSKDCSGQFVEAITQDSCYVTAKGSWSNSGMSSKPLKQ